MAETGRVVLHTFYLSSCAWRVRLALAWKGIPYEYKSWNINKSENQSEEYKKINPLQVVPSLEIDGEILNDSVSIVEYLEEKFPNKKPLFPKDLKKRAAIRTVVNIIAAGIQPLQNSRVLKAIDERAGEHAKLEWAQMWIVRGFTALEDTIGKYAGKYCFGDEFSMADCFLVPQIYNALRFKVDMGKFPTLERVYKNLQELEFVTNSAPEYQPDYE